VPKARAQAADAALRAYLWAAAESLSKGLVLLALVILGGCAASPGPLPEGLSTPAQAVELQVPGCDVVLSPEPAFEAVTTVAAARWQHASGCNVSVGENGIPVRWDTENLVPEGKRARTHFENGVPVYIAYKRNSTISADPSSLTYQMAESLLTHEVGHVLGFDGHTDGVMAEAPAIGALISASVLENVCDVVECTSFQPEG
jgi:hypothetical protein